MTANGADLRDTAPSGGSANRLIVTIRTIVTTLIHSLDSTMANVALPYMQGSMSASRDNINRVNKYWKHK
jgi:DHA2 family multidrug resistance protein